MHTLTEGSRIIKVTRLLRRNCRMASGIAHDQAGGNRVGVRQYTDGVDQTLLGDAEERISARQPLAHRNEQTTKILRMLSRERSRNIAVCERI